MIFDKPRRGVAIDMIDGLGINHADLSLVKGLFGPAPRIPGIDVAGRIAALGAGVKGLEIGARVVLNPAVTCGLVAAGRCPAGPTSW